MFDSRWDGKEQRTLLAICLPASESLDIFALAKDDKNTLKVKPLSQMRAISAVPLVATRADMLDLLVLKPDNKLAILTHGTREIPINIGTPNSNSVITPDATRMDIDVGQSPTISHGKVVAVEGSVSSSVTLRFAEGWSSRVVFNLRPGPGLTRKCLHSLSQTLPADICFALHRNFLELWSVQGLSTSDGIDFQCFTAALYCTFDLKDAADPPLPPPDTAVGSWQGLANSPSHHRFREDASLKNLVLPSAALPTPQFHRKPHQLLAPLLYTLHTLGEELRLDVHHYQLLLQLAPVICKIAFVIRPEWADYWKRLCPDAISTWPSPTGSSKHLPLLLNAKLTPRQQ